MNRKKCKTWINSIIKEVIKSLIVQLLFPLVGYIMEGIMLLSVGAIKIALVKAVPVIIKILIVLLL